MLLTPPPAQTPHMRNRGSTSLLLHPRVTPLPRKLPRACFLASLVVGTESSLVCGEGGVGGEVCGCDVESCVYCGDGTG